MHSNEFRRSGHLLVEWIADYLDHSDRYPVLSRVQPGAITAALPDAAPEDPESFEAIMADFERVLVPGLTHWNHPGFMAYFAITGSPPGVLADFLSAALNQQAMLWRTSPAATELEAVTLGWLRRLIGLPVTFEGVIYDTASIATLHALVAAREAAVEEVRRKGLAGRTGVPALRVYCSDQTHSWIDKAVITIGLGHESLRKIPSDDRYQMRADALAAAIREDRAAGVQPLAVVATVGTTSTTSIDPVPAIAELCARERLWLHVDAAYGGVAAMLPSHAHVHLVEFGGTVSVVCLDARVPAQRGVAGRQEFDGYGRPARPPISIGEAVDDPARVRRAGAARTAGGTLAAGAGARLVGRCASRFRAHGARSLQRRLLPVEAARRGALGPGARCRQREVDRSRERFRRSVSLTHAARGPADIAPGDWSSPH